MLEKKPLKFQRLLWASISCVLLSRGNYLLVLENDLVGGWLQCKWASTVTCPAEKLVIPDNWTCLFSNPELKANPLLCFSETQILKFKSQLTFAFFATINLLSGPLRKQSFTVTGSKSHSLWFVIGGFHPFVVFLCFKVHCLWSLYDWPQQKVQVWR